MLAVEILNHPLVNLIGWTLLHFLWQGAIVGVIVAALLAGLRRRSASVRYVVGIVGLAVMAVCPLITMATLPRAEVASLAVSDLPVTSSVEFDVVPTTEIVFDATAVELPEPVLVADGPELEVSFSERVANWTPWIAGVWFVGVALLSLRLLFSWFQVRRMGRAGISAVGDRVQSLFDDISQRLALRRVVRVFESSLIAVPATIGWLRPIVLLPATAITGLTDEQLTAVLAHELAHVRRHDYAVNLVQGVIETLLFFHPAVWLLSSRIRTEREHCCDDEAVSTTGKPTEYARALTQLATIGAAPPLATAATDGELTTRVRRLVQRSAPATAAPRLSGLITLLTLLLVCVSVSSSEMAEPQQKTDKQTDKSQIGTDPVWIIAKHAIIFEGKQVVKWEHIKESLADLAARAGEVSVSFRFTPGAMDKFDMVQLDLFEVMSTLPRNVPISIGPGALAKYDKVRIQADLLPDPKLRILGRAFRPDGKPAGGSDVVVLPTPGKAGDVKVYMKGTGLRNKVKHDYRAAKRTGGFVVHPQGEERILIVHESGYSLQSVEQLRETPSFRLKPWARVVGQVFETPGHKQSINLTVQPEKFLNFMYYDVSVDEDGKYAQPVVAGRVAASRSLKTENGSESRGVETWTLQAGQVQSFDLKAMTAYELEGLELDKKQVSAALNGKSLSAEDVQRIRERMEIDRQKRDVVAKAQQNPKPDATTKKSDKALSQAALSERAKSRVIGQVFQPDKEPARGAQILLLSSKSSGLVEPVVSLDGYRVVGSDELPVQKANANGGFAVYPKEGQRVVFLHKTGFAIVAPGGIRKVAGVELKPWARVAGTVKEPKTQTLRFSVTTTDGIRFAGADLETNATGKYETVLPPGVVVPWRDVVLDADHGVSSPVEEWQMKAGQQKAFSLPALSARELERLKQQSQDEPRARNEAQDRVREADALRDEALKMKKEVDGLLEKQQTEEQDKSKGYLYDRAEPRLLPLREELKQEIQDLKAAAEEVRKEKAELERRVDKQRLIQESNNRARASKEKLEREIEQLKVSFLAHHAKTGNPARTWVVTPRLIVYRGKVVTSEQVEKAIIAFSRVYEQNDIGFYFSRSVSGHPTALTDSNDRHA